MKWSYKSKQSNNQRHHSFKCIRIRWNGNNAITVEKIFEKSQETIKMKFTIVFLVLAVVIGSAVSDGDLVGFETLNNIPNRNSNNGRIVGGQAARVGQFPYQASIIADQLSFCGGSIISKDWVLTAAHCTYKFKSFELGFGSINYNSPAVKMTSTVAIPHPYYDERSLFNDVSLIRLPNSLSFTTNIQPIRLPTQGQVSNTFVDYNVIASGFGLTSGTSSKLI